MDCVSEITVMFYRSCVLASVDFVIPDKINVSFIMVSIFQCASLIDQPVFCISS